MEMRGSLAGCDTCGGMFGGGVLPRGVTGGEFVWRAKAWMGVRLQALRLGPRQRRWTEERYTLLYGSAPS